MSKREHHTVENADELSAEDKALLTALNYFVERPHNVSHSQDMRRNVRP